MNFSLNRGEILLDNRDVGYVADANVQMVDNYYGDLYTTVNVIFRVDHDKAELFQQAINNQKQFEITEADVRTTKMTATERAIKV